MKLGRRYRLVHVASTSGHQPCCSPHCSFFADRLIMSLLYYYDHLFGWVTEGREMNKLGASDGDNELLGLIGLKNGKVYVPKGMSGSQLMVVRFEIAYQVPYLPNPAHSPCPDAHSLHRAYGMWIAARTTARWRMVAAHERSKGHKLSLRFAPANGHRCK
jgi:hypothetical protein